MSVSTTQADTVKENRKDDGCTCLNKSSTSDAACSDLRLEEDVDGQNSVVENRGETRESCSTPKSAAAADGNSGDATKRKVLDTLPRYIQILLDFVGVHSDAILLACKINDELIGQLNAAAARLHQIADTAEFGKSFVEELKANSQEFEHFKIRKGHEKLIAIARKQIKEEVKSYENCQREQPEFEFEIPLSSYDDRSHNCC